MSDIQTIGILGGGQLGRMLSVAASRLGLRCHVYEPGAAPAGDVAWRVTNAPYEDEAALRAFADSVDVITYEFENVPSETAATLSAHTLLAPNAQALAVSQDRFLEKSFVAGLGIDVAPFAAFSDEAELIEALDVPVVLAADPVALTARVREAGTDLDASAQAARVLSHLARAGIVVDNFSLDQPSLDEVFLALTGHMAEESDRALEEQAS